MRARSLTAGVVASGVLALTATSAMAVPSGTEDAGSFYVSPHGDDMNTGDSPRQPFRHIQRCAQVLEPGDSCFVMAGDYRETVRPTRSGTAQRPITYRPYQGAEVTVTGTDPVAEWRTVTAADVAKLAVDDPFIGQSGFANGVRAGKVYQAHVPLDPSLPGTTVFFDGKQLPHAQWPYSGPDPLAPTTVQRAKRGTTDTTIADPALDQKADYWVGAKVYSTYWYVSETNEVTASAPGSVSVPEPSDVGMVPKKTRYYLYGTLKVLSHPGQWFYAEDTQTLYLWPPNDLPPDEHVVDVGQRQYGFDLDGISHTRIEGLNLRAASVRTGDTSTGVVLDGLDARYVESYWDDIEWYGVQGASGIVVRGHDNTVTNSVIAHSGGDGIALLGHDNTVRNNVVHDVDTMGVYAAGVTVQGHDQTVTHNTIYRVGRANINVPVIVPDGQEFLDNRIAYNDLSDFARLNTDAGGFYSCCEHDMSGTSIDHNWVHDASPMPGSSLFGPEAGIYVDNGDYDALVHSNVGWDVEAGVVKVHHNNLTPPTGSRVYNNDAYGQETVVQLLNIPDSTGTEVVNNIGDITLSNVDQTHLRLSHNLPASSDPRFIDPTRCDFNVKPGSPARGAGIEIPGVTDGHTDPQPSIGAYQYGASHWRAGSSLATPSCPRTEGLLR